jgi:flagellar assembly protein FliH
MSSSDAGETRVRAMTWALDEFAMPDIFPMDGAEAEEYAEPDNSHEVAAAERSRFESDAHARGRAEGERTVREGMAAEVASAVAALNAACAAVQMHEARWVANAEENIAALAVAVARHIVQREVVTDPATVRALVARALVELPVDSTIVVRLHPEDIAACGGLPVQDASGRTSDVRFTADPAIMRGGCLIEGRERIIDGRLDTSLIRAYRAIGNLQA